MISVKQLSAITLSGLFLGLSLMQTANAVGTPSGTQVDNLATVNYEVGGVSQLPIESAPAGNSTPGVGNGTVTRFLVDNVVDLTVAEVGGAATPVNPGQGSAVTTFTVTNTGNTAQDYALTAANLTSADAAVHGNADTDIDMNNLQVFVDSNGNGTYEAGVDNTSFIDSLAADASISVFIVADVPIGAGNNDVANVRLTAVTHDAGSGATSPTTETAGADNALAVDVVFGDAGRDGQEEADDGYIVSAADIQVTKTSTVISDPFNGTTDPKAIPGAVIEYVITANNSGSVDADSVRFTDVLDASVTLALGQYNGGASDIQIDVGSGPTTSFCTADAGDGDSDGCGLSGGTLEVDTGLTVGTTGTDNPVVIRFRVTVN